MACVFEFVVFEKLLQAVNEGPQFTLAATPSKEAGDVEPIKISRDNVESIRLCSFFFRSRRRIWGGFVQVARGKILSQRLYFKFECSNDTRDQCAHTFCNSSK